MILLAANLFLGIILTNQSGEALRTQIRTRMPDVSESAAALLGGDALGQLTAEDEGIEPYKGQWILITVFVIGLLSLLAGGLIAFRRADEAMCGHKARYYASR